MSDDSLNDCPCAGCAGEWYCALHPKTATTPSPTARLDALVSAISALQVDGSDMDEDAMRAAIVASGAVFVDGALVAAVREARRMADFGEVPFFGGPPEAEREHAEKLHNDALIALGRHVAGQLK